MAVFSAAGLSTAPVVNILDEGLYSVQIQKAESMLSKQKGTPGLHFELTVLEGPVQNSTGASPIGRKVFHTLWISTDGPGRAIGLQKLAKLCKVTQVPQDDELDLDQFIGKELIIRVKHRLYNGEPQEEVVDFKELRA